MIYLSLALVALVAFQSWLQGKERIEWGKERHILINRIQHPQMIQHAATNQKLQSTEETTEMDEIGDVGRVVKRGY